MAAMYGSIVDALHAVDLMLMETPDGRYLIYRVISGDPWNVVRTCDGRAHLPAESVARFNDVIIVDSEVMDGLERLAEGMREGG